MAQRVKSWAVCFLLWFIPCYQPCDCQYNTVQYQHRPYKIPCHSAPAFRVASFTIFVSRLFCFSLVEQTAWVAGCTRIEGVPKRPNHPMCRIPPESPPAALGLKPYCTSGLPAYCLTRTYWRGCRNVPDYVTFRDWMLHLSGATGTSYLFHYSPSFPIISRKSLNSFSSVRSLTIILTASRLS